MSMIDVSVVAGYKSAEQVAELSQLYREIAEESVRQGELEQAGKYFTKAITTGFKAPTHFYMVNTRRSRGYRYKLF